MTGKELWRVEERDQSLGQHAAGLRPRPRLLLDRLPRGQLLAVQPDGRGDVTGVARRLEHQPQRAEASRRSCSLGDLLFMINDGGIASALDAKTGDEVWTARVGGSFSASPLAAEGRIYFFE